MVHTGLVRVCPASASRVSGRSPDERSDIRVDGSRKTIPAYRHAHAGCLLRSAHSTTPQNALGNPAWRKIALAVCRLGMPIGTAKFRLVIGLCQISWLPLPCRTSVQPAARNNSRNGRSNCGAIQATAGSASRSAVICKIQRRRIDGGVIVRQQIERHRGYLRQQFVERRRVGGGGNVIAVSAPHRRLVVPCGGNREDHGFRHIGSVRSRERERARV